MGPQPDPRALGEPDTPEQALERFLDALAADHGAHLPAERRTILASHIIELARGATATELMIAKTALEQFHEQAARREARSI